MPRPLVAPGAPYYDNVQELIGAVQTLRNYHGERDVRNRCFTITLNDYRGRFVNCRQDEDNLVIEATGDKLNDARFVGRVSTPDGLVQIDEAATAEQRITLPKLVTHGSFSLIASDGEVLDYLTLRLPLQAPRPPGHENLSEFVQSLLLMGENAVAEFKPWIDLSSKKFDQVLHTAVAMANGNGGHIVVGVDDHGAPEWTSNKTIPKYMGIAADKRKSQGKTKETTEDGSGSPTEDLRLLAINIYGSKLRDEIQKNINVSPVITLEVVGMDRDSVLLMRVEPGPNRPYQDKRSNRILIRSNATNRSPTAAEIRELLARR